jgi:ATP-dependent Clp protease ATP-binding subunit ClpB
VEIQLTGLRKRLADRKIQLELTDKAKKFLAEKGFDAAYGARPLKRVLQRELQDQLAEKLLAGEIPDGTNLLIDADKHGLLVEKQLVN